MKPANNLMALMLIVMISLLTGCATTGNNPKDPMEGVNRAMFNVHEGIDTVLIKPTAQAYNALTPIPVQTGLDNFLSNLNDIPIGLNSLLQGKGGDAAGDWSRVLINTTFGVFGLFDIATDAGLEKHDEDFGQTFGVWGAEPGAYVFIPVLGPHNVRDTAGMFFDFRADVLWGLEDIRLRNSITALRIINYRANLLPADKVIEEAAMDKYAYIRDGYMQRRKYLVYDGNPPRNRDDDE